MIYCCLAQACERLKAWATGLSWAREVRCPRFFSPTPLTALLRQGLKLKPPLALECQLLSFAVLCARSAVAELVFKSHGAPHAQRKQLTLSYSQCASRDAKRYISIASRSKPGLPDLIAHSILFSLVLERANLSPNLSQLAPLRQIWLKLVVEPKGPSQTALQAVWEHYEQAANEWDSVFGGHEYKCCEIPDTKGELPDADMGKEFCGLCGNDSRPLIKRWPVGTDLEGEVLVL